MPSVKDYAQRSRPGILSLVLITFLAILTLVTIKPPEGTIFLSELQDAGHTLLFALLGLACLWVMRTQIPGPASRHPLVAYVATLLFCLFLGSATEFAQSFTASRHGNIFDLLRDMAGAGGALGIYSLFDRSLKGQYSALSKAIVATASIFAFGWALQPVLLWSVSYIQRTRMFPVLEDFSPRWSPSFLITSNSILERVPASNVTGLPNNFRWAYLGKVEFTEGRWPSLTLREPSTDWSGYESLAFEVLNTSQESKILNIRIDDKMHTGEFADRFNAEWELEPGLTSIHIPLQEIANGPRDRQLDTKSIARVIVFARQPEKAFALYISPIRLE